MGSPLTHAAVASSTHRSGLCGPPHCASSPRARRISFTGDHLFHHDLRLTSCSGPLCCLSPSSRRARPPRLHSAPLHTVGLTQTGDWSRSSTACGQLVVTNMDIHQVQTTGPFFLCRPYLLSLCLRSFPGLCPFDGLGTALGRSWKPPWSPRTSTP